MNYEAQLPEGGSNSIDILRWVLWVCVILGVAGSLVGGALLAKAKSTGYPEDAGKGVLPLIGGILVLISAFFVRVAILPSSDSDDITADTSPVGVPTTDVAPPAPVDTLPSEPIDWTPLIWIGAAVLAIALLALAGYLVVRTRHRILDRKTTAQTLATDFAAARSLYAQVAGAYAEYLADPYAIFTRPQLDNLDEPRTAAFINAFADAGALDTETCPGSFERVQALADAARSAQQAWNIADQHARTIGMGVQTFAGKRTVRRIRSALELALDDSAAAGERETAIATIERLSDGLMTVPDRVYAKAKTAIETTTRKQLTS